MAGYVSITSKTDITPTWPLTDSNTLQNRVEKLSNLCGIPSSNKVKNYLLNKDGLYLNFPQSKNDQAVVMKQQPNLHKSRKAKRMPKKPVEVMEREISPGYLYRRTSHDVHVTLTDDFWKNTVLRENNNEESDDVYNAENVSEMLSCFKHEIDQLRVLYEEEKFARKTDLIKIKDDHIRELQHLEQGHLENIRGIEHTRDIEKKEAATKHQEEIEAFTNILNTEKAHLQGELQMVKEQLEMHKSFVNEEMDRKWKDREVDLVHELEEKTQNLLLEQRTDLLKEKNFALDQLTSENNKHLVNVMEQHQQEMDKLLRKFASSVHEADKLRMAQRELEILREKNTDLNSQLEDTIKTLRKTENELKDVKMKLSGFENQVSDKVSEVEERFSIRIDDLMKQNINFSRKYLKKCEEVHYLNTKLDAKHTGETTDAKSLMQSVILSRARTNVSLTAACAQDIEMPVRKPDQTRPRKYSVPVTVIEKKIAIIDSSEQKPGSPSVKERNVRSSRGIRSGGKVVLPALGEKNSPSPTLRFSTPLSDDTL